MYTVERSEEAAGHIAALPAEALPSFAELALILELQPWSGDSLNRKNPDGQVRTHTFGYHSAGLAIYLILEEQRRVVVLRVLWAG
ncbi:hypothetical protein ACGFIV_01085 [Sphaerisporangium sp. NPDC049003]|uniref:hypothetical protein n=1 Tax=Sphaerisporangium sp. NPDC049003 TaxID=3364517 RepID=UPI0037164262